MSTPTTDDLAAALASVQAAAADSGAFALGTSANRAMNKSVADAAALCATGLQAVNQDIAGLISASVAKGSPLPASSVVSAIGLLGACSSASAYLAMVVTVQGYIGRINANLRAV